MIVTGDAKKYARLEFQFEDKIDFIKIIRPDGKEDKVFSFLYQPIIVSYDEEGFESVVKDGQPIYTCRYTPDFVGRAEIEAYKSDILKEKISMEILLSDLPGYVRISEKDGKYFSYSNGKTFFSIGINTAFPSCYGKDSEAEFKLGGAYGFLGLRQYEYWFKRLSENGVNVARIWVGHEYFSPDTLFADEFDYGQFSKIDAVLNLAKKYGIKLKLTLEQFRFFDYDRKAETASYDDDIFRKFSKKLYRGEKRCENIKEWLNDDLWRTAWLKKVYEFSKRYSGDTEIFAVELWNEMNSFGYWEDVVDWNNEMLPKVKELFPNNLVINSLGSLDADYAMEHYRTFYRDKSEFVQVHRYLDQGAPFEVCRNNPIELLRDVFYTIKTDKPLFIAETGAVNNRHSGLFKYYPTDDDGIILADTVYTPVFCKSCGVGNIWHWDERYVESKNLYKLYRPISELICGIKFDRENFKPLDLSNDDVYCLVLKGNTTAIGYIRNKAYNWKNVLRDYREVLPVESFEFKFDGAKNAGCIPVWEKDTTKLQSDNGTLRFSDIYMGCLFKIHF